MNNLTDFLRARFDEDEETARAVAWDGSGNSLSWGLAASATVEVGEDEFNTDDRTVANHIVNNDPARVLREVEAKQRIMECHEPWVAANGDIICGRCGREHIDGRPGGHFPCQTLRILALPYCDHPDYRDEWRP